MLIYVLPLPKKMRSTLQSLSAGLKKGYLPNCQYRFPVMMLILILLLGVSAVYAGNWDQFRGNGRNGHVIMPDDMQWTEPRLLWTQEIGSGFSEVVVVDNTIYLLMAEKTDSIAGYETLVSMDAATGKKHWGTRIDDVFIDVDDWGDGPRSTPAVDENNVYSLSASGKLVAINRKNGEIIWSVDFIEQYGSTRPRWGYSTSPVLLDDKVIIEVGGKDNHGFAAFSKSTGKLIWNAGDVAAGYNSAMVAEVDGKQMILFANGSNLYAFNRKGDNLWTYTMPLRSPMALPLFIEPDLLFVSAANDAGSFIIRISGEEPEETMRSSIMRNDWSSSSYKNGYIYGFNVATMQCIDAETGRRVWLTRGFGKGSLILIGDRLVILSDLGRLTFAEATPEEYREIEVLEGIEGRSWTAPSFANGRLYIRNHTTIACYQIMEKTMEEGS